MVSIGPVDGVAVEVLSPAGPWRRAADALAQTLPACDRRVSAGTIILDARIPPRPCDPPDVDGPDVTAWLRRTSPALWLGPIWVGAAERCVQVGTVAAGAGAAVDRALPFALSWLLGGLDLWVVHGAALVAPGRARRGVILALGAAGAGKSTTAAAALSSGWSVLGDDLAVVRATESAVDTAGIPRPIALPCDIARPGLTHPIEGDRRGRQRPVDHEGLPSARGFWPARAVVVVDHGQEEHTMVERLDPATSLRAVLGAHFAAGVPDRVASWFPVAARLARLPAWRLLLGVDPRQRLASTRRALIQVAAGSAAHSG
jgi:hypothetical protein